MNMKAKLLISAVVLGMGLPLALPAVANAAEGDTASSDSAATSATKSAQVKVDAGLLTLSKDGSGNLMAPSFVFGDAKVSTKDQGSLKATGFSNTKNASDTYTGSTLSVDDNSGAGKGWDVTATLSDFSDGASHTLDGANMTMTASGIESDTKDTLPTAPKTTLTAGGAAAPVFSAAVGSGMGNSKADFAGTTLDLPTADYAGTYTADLTYTLAAGPTA
ncbi:WxL domain-containing protein [Levilactobacillus huananensis]|uniref:WxL domain-containing protein n=1 Tax=Levilactobacillus huananensis TaxID=2486019 RepID=UPI0013DDAE62|nr:WxL domain-containing protein [Levilactobacillus huananensis]